MKRLPLLSLFVLPLVFACNDDGKSDDTTTGPSSTEQGDGDGDGDKTGDGDGENTGDGDTGDGDGDPACIPGELNCDCNAGQCLGDLECVNNTCVASCIPGELGCECNGGQCLGDLECVGDVCTDPNCIPGELGCECNGGQCLGDLECVGNLCMEASGDGDGDGDPPCPNPNEMMCDGQCIDVMENNDNCGSCGNVCNWIPKGLPPIGSCLDGACQPTIYPCVSQNDGFVNCDEVCASHNQACAEEMCWGDTHVYSNNLAMCNTGNVATGSGLNCGNPFGWGQGDYIGCCCTQ